MKTPSMKDLPRINAELLETLKGLVEYMRVDPEAVFANDKAFRRKCLNNWVVAAEEVIAKAESVKP